MPTYVYKCPKPTCGKVYERFHKIADYDKPTACVCGEIGVKQITPVLGFVQPNYEAYRCPVTGKVVDGKKKHLENLKQTGCRLLEPGEKDQMLVTKAKAEEAFDKAVESIVDQAISELPFEKKETLAKEISSGVDAQVVRH